MSSLHYDVLVLGGGTAGCVLAGRLSENSASSVCLVEAGPDYGPHAEGRWPTELLDARRMPGTHSWGFGDARASRARVIGGCSAHNACMVAWGTRADYDEWSAFSDRRWDFRHLEPYMRRAESALQSRPHSEDEIGPWDRAFVRACAAQGYATGTLFNDLDLAEQASSYPINAVGDVRWNAAFAYLDPARGRRNLTVLADTLVDRLTLDGARVSNVRVLRNGEQLDLSAELLIMAAGAYATPAILQRSGIGAEASLRSAGIRTVHRLDGVGANLIDHSGTWMQAAPSRTLLDACRTLGERLFQSTVVLKASSTPSDGPFDLHLVCWTEMEQDAFYIIPKLMKPRSVGRVTVVSAEPTVLPDVDHGFLSDEGGHDLRRLVEGLRISRRVLEKCDVVEGEIAPGIDADLERFVSKDVSGYYHPVGTCRMGLADDNFAVVDADCGVHGIENLLIADTSVMPTIPRANTNLTVVAIAERVAAMVARKELQPLGEGPASGV